jgi:hypothetical protein
MELLQPDEIAVITRRHYNAGQTTDLDQIIRRQKVDPKIKLLLCTCLISEGVNIKNANIGRIYTVDLRCTDTFRQFVARFRKLETVNIFSILGAERDLQPEFFFPAALELAERFEAAQLQARHLQSRQQYWSKDYDVDELPYLEQIQRQIDYHHESKLLQLVYHDGREWRADVLHVLSSLRGRMLATANNCYFYSRLREVGFSVLRIQQLVVEEEVAQAVDTARAVSQLAEEAFLDELRQELATPDIHTPVNGLYLLYRERGNRHGMEQLRRLAGDLIEEDDAATLAWLTLNRRRLNREARDLILRTVRLYSMGVQQREDYLSMSKAEWRRRLRRLTFHFENEAFEQRGNRKKMLAEHKEEIRIKRRMAELIDQHAGREMNPQELQELLRVMNARRSSGTVIDVMSLSPAQAVNLALEVSASETVGQGRSRTIVLGRKWSANHPPPGAVSCWNLSANPLRILAFSG